MTVCTCLLFRRIRILWVYACRCLLIFYVFYLCFFLVSFVFLSSVPFPFASSISDQPFFSSSLFSCVLISGNRSISSLDNFSWSGQCFRSTSNSFWISFLLFCGVWPGLASRSPSFFVSSISFWVLFAKLSYASGLIKDFTVFSIELTNVFLFRT